MVTIKYVMGRFEKFVVKYEKVLRQFAYDEDYILERVNSLKHRLSARDFKLYGDKPINILHGGKRVTRFLIKSAIEFSPAQKAKVARMRTEYSNACELERKRTGDVLFFSFESAYAKKLKVPLTPFKKLFYI